MRMIGSVADMDGAERFVDYLLTLGIEASAEEIDGKCVIWVEDDRHLERAMAELDKFNRDPQDAKYDAGREAQRLRRERERQSDRLRRQHIDVRTSWQRAASGAQPLTIVLIAICLVVAAASQLGAQREPVLNWLLFSTVSEAEVHAQVAESIFDQMEQEAPGEPPMQDLRRQHGGQEAATAWLHIDRLTELRRGQLWRLVTPMFIHFGPLHLIFNLFWLHALGGQIESRKGWGWLLAMVLGISLIANVSQFAWSGWPLFGGMSGVMYGLFGYIWIKTRLQPHEQFALGEHTVLIMLVWLVLCMTGMIGNIANAAHVGGLIAGAGLACAAYGTVRLRRWRRTQMTRFE